MNPGEAFDRVQHEIQRAKAETLGRAGERLEAALAALAALDRRLDSALTGGPQGTAGPSEPGLEAAARNRLREEALRLLHVLLIQREALGITRHDPVFQRYPVPPPREL